VRKSTLGKAAEIGDDAIGVVEHSVLAAWSAPLTIRLMFENSVIVTFDDVPVVELNFTSGVIMMISKVALALPGLLNSIPSSILSKVRLTTHNPFKVFSSQRAP
jgi:hypothetical protein